MSDKDDLKFPHYTTWEDQALVNGIELQDSWIEGSKKEIAKREKIKADYQRELDRRVLETYADLIPLKAGEQLIITDEYNDWYSRHTHNSSWFDVGEVFTITKVNKQGEVYVKGDSHQFWISEPSIAYQMRRAYLASEASTHEDTH